MAAIYRILADAVGVAHIAYVAFVVLGFVAILIGAALRWSWVRDFRFRAAHLGAIALVCIESVAGVMCPLTTLEDWLRRRAGDMQSQGDFVEYWTHRLIFFDFAPWVFESIYIAFAMLVALTLVAFPPRLPARLRMIDRNPRLQG